METTSEPIPNGRIGDLLHRITDDVKVLARDEVELVREELKDTARRAAVDAGAVLIGAMVVLIGVGMLCAVIVAALEPVIPALWARLLVMALAYLAIGGALAFGFATRLRRSATPHFSAARYEGSRVLSGITETIVKSEGRTHA